MSAKWPKTFPSLTPEQQRISDDFMKHWHEVLPNKFGVIDRFNHSYPVTHAPAAFSRTLEIGAGIGEHLKYEKLTPEQESAYHALELRENMSAAIRERFPNVQTVTGDCQARLPHPDGYFDRILAIHVLEHLGERVAVVTASAFKAPCATWPAAKVPSMIMKSMALSVTSFIASGAVL